MHCITINIKKKNAYKSIAINYHIINVSLNYHNYQSVINYAKQIEVIFFVIHGC